MTCHGREAKSVPVPLPATKESSQHSTHLIQCCSAHVGRGWQHLWLLGCTSRSASPSSPGKGGTISTADSLLFPYRHPWCCPTLPPGQQHLLPHSILQHIPPIIPSEGWTQGSPALQLGSEPSKNTNDIKPVCVSPAQLALWLSHILPVAWGMEQPALQSHGTPQHIISTNTEISEGNPRQLSQNPQEVELKQGKPLFY